MSWRKFERLKAKVEFITCFFIMAGVTLTFVRFFMGV
jgi:hypothetical protein